MEKTPASSSHSFPITVLPEVLCCGAWDLGPSCSLSLGSVPTPSQGPLLKTLPPSPSPEFYSLLCSVREKTVPTSWELLWWISSSPKCSDVAFHCESNDLIHFHLDATLHGLESSILCRAWWHDYWETVSLKNSARTIFSLCKKARRSVIILIILTGVVIRASSLLHTEIGELGGTFTSFLCPVTLHSFVFLFWPSPQAA